MKNAPEGFKIDRYGRLRVVEPQPDYDTHNLRPYRYACETMNRRTR